eukprot:TRINITY_DN19095_c0_g2_i1.p1 TRINITY_DN19095_c0_g2~~TRINITY_DN19095_c0_g2_i1.p1  ORF type:complete len:497 (+),score=65.45 TRINITY_DN19095_c0_g2_i1:35-1525(+)
MFPTPLKSSDPKCFLHGPRMWASGVLAPDGKIWAVPCHAGRVLCLDPVTGESELVGPELPDDSWKYSVAVLGPDGCVWGVPCNAARCLRVDIKTREVSYYGPEFGVRGKYYAACLGHDECIYAVPSDAGKVLRIDCINKDVREIGHPLGGTTKYIACAVGSDGCIYAPPFNAGRVLRIDTGRQVRQIGPELYFAGGGGYASAVCGSDGNVCALPSSASHILHIKCGADPVVQTIGPEFPAMPHKFNAGILAEDGCIYGIPCNAGRVLRLRPLGLDQGGEEGAAKDVSVEEIGPEMYAYPAIEEKWRSCALGGDGYIYAMPANAPVVLRIYAPAEPDEDDDLALPVNLPDRSDILSEVEVPPPPAPEPEKPQLPPEKRHPVLKIGDLKDMNEDQLYELEEWRKIKESQGVSIFGPYFYHPVERIRWRAVIATASGDRIYGLPHNCGQIMSISCDGHEATAESIELLGPAPPVPPRPKWMDFEAEIEEMNAEEEDGEE